MRRVVIQFLCGRAWARAGYGDGGGAHAAVLAGLGGTDGGARVCAAAGRVRLRAGIEGYCVRIGADRGGAGRERGRAC